MKSLYYRALRGLISFFAQIIQHLRSPGSRKHIVHDDVRAALLQLSIGDMILTRTEGELSTMIIPGFWSHISVYSGNSEVVEALPAGVVKRSLFDLLMHTDNFAIIKVRDISFQQRQNVVKYCRDQLGKPYDYKMNTESHDAFYCTELALKAINFALNFEYLSPRSRMGLMTITPDDFYKAAKKLKVLLEIRKK